MANPEIQDGYTKIGNKILEALARIDLTNYQFRVLMVLIRKIWGWQKKKDRVAQSQIVEATGIAQPNVSRILKELKAKRIIIKDNQMILINENYNHWKGLRRKYINTDNHGKVELLNEKSNKSKGLNGKYINPEEKYISADIKNISQQTYTKETKEINKRKHTVFLEIQKNAEEISQDLIECFRQFNFNQWIEEQINKEKHPEAITECLQILWQNRKVIKKGPRPYLTQLMKIKGPNANERDAIAAHEERKREELTWGSNG